MKRTDSRRRPANRRQRKARTRFRKELAWAIKWHRQHLGEHMKGRIMLVSTLASFPGVAERLRQLYETDAENHRKEVMDGTHL